MATSSAQDQDLAVLADLTGAAREAAFGRLFESYRVRLQRMIELRLGADLRRRMDAADVLQETWIEASSRLDEFLADPRMSLFLWLRFLARQRLVTIRRAHFGVQRRDPRREVSWVADGSEVPADMLAVRLIGHMTTPTRAARRNEQGRRVRAALAALEPIDREILSLRHYEQLTNKEVATELGIDTSAASKRYVRAIRKLRGCLGSLEDGL